VASAEHDVRRVLATSPALASRRDHVGTDRAPYSWPSEIDVVAHIAGLERIDRRNGWNDEPFTDKIDRHGSVYGPLWRCAR
jgi:hypothetical protein